MAQSDTAAQPAEGKDTATGKVEVEEHEAPIAPADPSVKRNAMFVGGVCLTSMTSLRTVRGECLL